MLSLNFPRILNSIQKYSQMISFNISNDKTSKSQRVHNINNKKKINTRSELQDIEGVSIALIGGGITPAYTALLLKQEKIIKSINVADVGDKSAGLLLDVSHVDTSTRIKYYKKNDIKEALRDVDIIALMNEDDFTYGKSNSEAQFLVSSRYVKEISEYIVRSCPMALLAIFAQPVTANLPLVSEIYKSAGCWDPNRIVGSLAIHSMRIEAMTANIHHLNPAFTSVPIVGGADPCTIVPLLSRAKPVNEFSIVRYPENRKWTKHKNENEFKSQHLFISDYQAQQESLVRSLRASENALAIINKCGRGPSLSMAAAITKLMITLASGYCGLQNTIASAYVRSNVLSPCKYFSNELEFGPSGIKKNFGMPKVSSNELELVEQSIPIINANVDLAVNFFNENRNKRSICNF